KAEVLGKVRKAGGHGLAAGEIFRLHGPAIGGEDKLGLGLAGGRTGPQCVQSGAHLTFVTDGDVNVVALQDTAGNVGAVGAAFAGAAQALDGGGLVIEGRQEGEGKFLRVE